MKRLVLILLLILLSPSFGFAAGSYQVVKLADGVYAALTVPGGRATSNAFFVVGDDYVVAGGAHFSREATSELTAAVASITSKPIRYFILAHHHLGYSSIDFDFPPGKEVIMSLQTWQRLESESRDFTSPALFFGSGLSLKLGDQVLVLTNLEQGHATGNLLVWLPKQKILYAGDLLYSGAVGWMGEGNMQDWVLALEFMESLEAGQIIPGQGPVSGNQQLVDYKNFLRAFLTEILKHIERGDSLAKTQRNLKLPAYRQLLGYDDFMKENIARAYEEMKALQRQ